MKKSLCGLLALAAFCSPPAAPETGVKVWLTTVDQKHLLDPQPPQPWDSQGQTEPSDSRVVMVNPTQRYQEIAGFGASITDSSASLLRKRLTEAQRARLWHDLFSREGIHLSLLRQPLGACDYSLNLYTYDDHAGDTGLQHFSVKPDQRYIFPCLREARAVNPDLKIIATPWTPPGWMKTSGSMVTGHLKPECYATYAEYLMRCLQAYKEEGAPIYALTPQNEPLYEPNTYPGCLMPANEEAAFIKVLGPLLASHGWGGVKLLIYDHNWDHPEYPLAVLADPEARRYVTGVAWHVYGGTHTAMDIVHRAYPDQEQWFTEASGGDWVPAFHDAFMDQMRNLIRATRNWSKSVIWWNLALDNEHGPSLLGDLSTCRGLLTVDRSSGQVQLNLDYYTLGHASKCVEPGARRVDSNTFPDDLEDVAFVNPDGSRVLLVSNRARQERWLWVREGARSFRYHVPAEAAVTFVWP